jgi:hypothetical protein
MSLPASIPAAIVETVLGQLALFFLAGASGDPQAGRQAAKACLAAYRPETEPELTLAADIICFGFHVRQSLYEAAELDRPINQVMRLRSGAASMSREAYRSLLKLEALQRERLAAQAPMQPEVVVSPPVAEPPMLDQVAPQAVDAALKTRRRPDPSAPRYAHLSKEAIRRLTPAQQKRIYLERMTENNRRRQAEQAALAAQQAAAATPPPAG